MKKNIIVTSVFLLTTLMSFSQDFDKFKIGFNIHPNISWLAPQDKHLTNEGSVARFGYGLTADIMFTDNYALGTGLSIDNSGGKLQYFTTEIEPGFVTLTDSTSIAVMNSKLISHKKNYNLKYLEIPLTLKMRTNEIGYMTYTFQFGLGLGFNIKAMASDHSVGTKLRTTSSNGATEEYFAIKDINEDFNEEKLNIKEEIKPLRMALIIGAGAEYNLSGSTSIIAGLTFNNGFTNIFKKEEKGLKLDSSGNPLFSETDGNDETFQLKANGSYLGLTIGILF